MSSLSIDNGLGREIFQASWPQSLSPDSALDKKFIDKVEAAFFTAIHLVVSVVFLPLKLVLFPFKAGIKNLVYPSPLVTFLNESERKEFKKVLKTQFGGESVSLKTPEGHNIDGMIFRGERKKAIIYCVGWKSYFEFQKRFDMLYDITQRVGNIHLMLFNPRGVGESEGKASSEGATLDLYSTFKYLTEVEQIDPSDIVIYGHSLGAGYGALGAELIQEEYPEAEINLLSERSFANYEDNARRLVLDRLPSCPNLAKVLGEIVAGAIRFCSWGVQAEEAVFSLKGKVCVVYDKMDEAVPFLGSFYKRIKERLAHEPPREHPIRCIKLFEPEVLPSGDYSPHTRYLTLWEEHEIANELKRMLGLDAEEPVNIRRVKEIGVERPPELRGDDKDFYVALHAVNRLYTDLERAENTTKSMLENVPMMFSGLETESLLLSHFRTQEAALRRTEENLFLIDTTPQGVKAFYLSVLARARTMLLLEQLEKNFRENRGVQEADRQLLQMLEDGNRISFERPTLNRLVNPAEWLYAETYQIHEQYRRDGAPWPELESLESGRLGFKGEVFFPHFVRLKALRHLKNQLLR